MHVVVMSIAVSARREVRMILSGVLLALALSASADDRKIVPRVYEDTDGLIAKLMGGFHWTDVENPDRSRKVIQSAIRTLARLPKDQLREEIVIYLSISRLGADGLDRTEKLLARAYDVGVLNRLVFRSEMPALVDKWFGPVGMYQNTPPWRKKGKQFELVMPYGLVSSGAGYDALGEFDALYAEFKKKQGLSSR